MVTMWLQSCLKTRASPPQQQMCTASEPRSSSVPQVLAAAVVCAWDISLLHRGWHWHCCLLHQRFLNALGDPGRSIKLALWS